jgi:hypothetical protein
MKAFSYLLLALLVLYAVFVQQVIADEAEDEDVEIDEEEIVAETIQDGMMSEEMDYEGELGPQISAEPLEGLVMTAVFPHHENKDFPIGEFFPVLLHVENYAPNTVNITALFGTIHSPFDYSRNIFNMTAVGIGEVVEEGASQTFMYMGLMPRGLDPVDMHVSFHVYYKDETLNQYAHPFFNETVRLHELPHAGESIQIAFMVLILLGSAAGIGYAAALKAGKTITISKPKAAADEGDDDWVDQSDATGGARKRNVAK